MTIKFNVLGVGLLAAMALGTLGVMSATADTGGHFASSASHTEIEGIESGSHQIHFAKEGAAEGQRSGCIFESYVGVLSATTVTEVNITPNWETCKTTGTEGHFGVDENGCSLKYTIGNFAHNTAHLICPTGAAIEVTHLNCTMTVPPQTVTGIVYASDGAGGITMQSTVKGIETQYHAGICIFLGTSHKSEMIGSVTVEGFDTDGNKVNIAATG